MDHSTYSENYIRGILNTVKTIALVGASANDVRPSFLVQKYLQQKGYRVFPVNPGRVGSEILGERVYATLSEIDDPIDMVDIFRNSQAVGPVVDEALTLIPAPQIIWMQLTVFNEEAAAKAENSGFKVVMNRCPKMEYGKLSGEWGWIGGNSGRISSKRPLASANRVQSLTIGNDKKRPGFP